MLAQSQRDRSRDGYKTACPRSQSWRPQGRAIFSLMGYKSRPFYFMGGSICPKCKKLGDFCECKESKEPERPDEAEKEADGGERSLYEEN